MYIALLKPEKNTRETVMFRMTNTVSYQNHQRDLSFRNQARSQLRKSSSANDARTLLQMSCHGAKNRFPVEQISTSSEMETTTTSCNDRYLCCNNSNNICDLKSLNGHGCSLQQHLSCSQSATTSSHHHHHHHNIYHHHPCLVRSIPNTSRHNCHNCCSCSSLAKYRRSASSNTHKRQNWPNSTTTSPVNTFKASSLSASNSNCLILPTPSPISCARSTTPSPRPDLSDCLVMSLLQPNQQSPTSPNFSVNSSSSKSSPSTVINNIIKADNANLLKQDTNGNDGNATSIKFSASTPSLVYSGQTNGKCVNQVDRSKETKTMLDNGHEKWPSIRVEARLSN